MIPKAAAEILPTAARSRVQRYTGSMQTTSPTRRSGFYSNLFSDPDPDAADKDYISCLNPDSLEVLTGCKLEKMLEGAAAPAQFQFLRMGYFCVDSKDSSPEHLVFNRAVALKDSFKK